MIGYVMAVAVNSQGAPTQFNWLIGSASLRDDFGHEAAPLKLPASDNLATLQLQWAANGEQSVGIGRIGASGSPAYVQRASTALGRRR